ncbi:MAG: hypothetical protein ACRD8Z_26985, partial [Nitrososphaeraceae archaeon]
MYLLILLISIIFAITFYSSNSVHATTLDSSSSEMGESSPNESSSCVRFDSEERIVMITCKTSNLSEISNQLIDQDILHRDETVEKGWILNAGITIAENATLYINTTDTSWLKILADGETAYPIT